MLGLEYIKKSRRDRKRIRELDKSSAEVWRAEFANVKCEGNDEETAYNAASAQTRPMDNERDWVIQKRLIDGARAMGLVIPEEYYEEDDWPLRTNLTTAGISWVEKQIYERRLSRAKDWIAIVMPILSLVTSSTIAILGLLVALKKH